MFAKKHTAITFVLWAWAMNFAFAQALDDTGFDSTHEYFGLETQHSVDELTTRWVEVLSDFDAEALDLLLDSMPADFDVNYTDRYGNSALMVALARSNRALMQRLVARGIDLNRRAYDGMAPIHYAARSGDMQSFRFLADQGADINAVNGLGESVLMVAVASGHAEVVRALVLAGSHLDTMDSAGRTPLIWAAIAGDLSVIKELVPVAGETLDQADSDGNTPVIHAAIRSHYDVVDFLVEKGADGTHTNHAGISAVEMIDSF